MSKRNSNGNPTDWAKFFAFWGLVISAALFVVSLILNKVGANLGSVAGIIQLIASIFLLLAIAIPAYRYVRGRRIAWKIIYWVCLVIAVVCDCLYTVL
jgi:hypothetical protein